MTKVSALTADASPTTTDYLYLVDTETGLSKKVLVSDFVTAIAGQIMPTGCILPYAGRSAPTGFLLPYGQNVNRTTYANLFNTIVPSLGTFTVTIASPGVFSLTSHGLKEGDAVYLTTTGALPTGLAQNTIYYVISAGLTADAFRLSATRGGSAINTSGSQSGVHTIRSCPFGLGDGSTTYGIPDLRGRSPQGADAMGGTAATRLSASGGGSGIYGQALGSTAGAETVTLTTAEMPSHSHAAGNSYNASTNVGTGGTGSNHLSLTNFGNQNLALANTGSGGAHNNMPPSIITNYIIKT